MGIDLRLLPFDADHSDFAFSNTVLSCDRDYALWEIIEKVEKEFGRPVISKFNTFLADNGHEYGLTTKTAYGKPLQYVLAEHLVGCLPANFRDTYKKNLAIWAYLNALDPETKVALYWH